MSPERLTTALRSLFCSTGSVLLRIFLRDVSMNVELGRIMVTVQLHLQKLARRGFVTATCRLSQCSLKTVDGYKGQY